MNFEETWGFIVGNDQPETPELQTLRKIAHAFYIAGDMEAAQRANGLVTAAIAARTAQLALETRQ